MPKPQASVQPPPPEEDGSSAGARASWIPVDVASQLTSIQPRLYGFILKRLADREQAVEVLQKTNLVICEKAGEFSPGSNFSAWVFTIARFQLMAWRKSVARERLVFTDSVYQAIDTAADTQAALAESRASVLQECLRKLPATDLMLIQQRYRDAVPLKEIAETFQKSADAIGMRLCRIRRRLATCIKHAEFVQ